MNPKDLFLSWGMLLLGVVMNVLGMYLIKMKMNSMGGIHVGSLGAVVQYFVVLLKSPLAMTGVIVFLAAPLPYAVAVSRMDLSLAYPLSIALSCMIIIPLTAVFFGESITVNKIVAFVLIFASLYFLYKK